MFEFPRSIVEKTPKKQRGGLERNQSNETAIQTRPEAQSINSQAGQCRQAPRLNNGSVVDHMFLKIGYSLEVIDWMLVGCWSFQPGAAILVIAEQPRWVVLQLDHFKRSTA